MNWSEIYKTFKEKEEEAREMRREAEEYRAIAEELAQENMELMENLNRYQEAYDNVTKKLIKMEMKERGVLI